LKILAKIFKFFSSLKLAVIIILSMAFLAAIGTIYESKYDAQVAQKLIYSAWPMRLVLTTLAVTLVCVMIDRWPWKIHHSSFICAHVGIIILMLGGLLTEYRGVDGSITFGIGEKNRFVSVNHTDLVVYASLDGSRYTKMYEHEVDFFLKPPKKYPIEIALPDNKIRIVDYYNYALHETKFEAATTRNAGPALRFQMQNPNVDFTQWITTTREKGAAEINLGPARVVLTEEPMAPTPGVNQIILQSQANKDELLYTIHTARGETNKKGKVKAGDVIETGWMGLKFRALKYIPQAIEKEYFTKVDYPTPLTQPAVAVEYDGKVNWMGLNSLMKLFSDNAVYIVTYGNRRLDLGFDLKLEKFEVGRYQGTMRAASYQSLVNVEGKETLISMNEPLKYKGYTFYQASFQEDEKGQPTASILSVNYDPGRPLKN
jgi:hypothetical protein